jgi:hypothetical protein
MTLRDSKPASDASGPQAVIPQHFSTTLPIGVTVPLLWPALLHLGTNVSARITSAVEKSTGSHVGHFSLVPLLRHESGMVFVISSDSFTTGFEDVSECSVALL